MITIIIEALTNVVADSKHELMINAIDHLVL